MFNAVNRFCDALLKSTTLRSLYFILYVLPHSHQTLCSVGGTNTWQTLHQPLKSYWHVTLVFIYLFLTL